MSTFPVGAMQVTVYDVADGGKGSATMILTTTPTIEGKRITEYHGIVTGEAIMGANIIKDFLAGVRDIVGGRSASYEKELHRAREVALKELEEKANVSARTRWSASTSTMRSLGTAPAC